MSDAELRALERATASGGGAAAWSALAQARARAGDPWRAYADAVRALRLDPTSPVRELLVPVARSSRCSPWAGLRRFGSRRTVMLPRVGTPPRFVEHPVVDLGGGIVAVSTDGRMVAIDLFTGALRWANEDGLRAEVTTGPDLVAVTLQERVVILVDAARGTVGRRIVLFDVDPSVDLDPGLEIQITLAVLPIGTQRVAVLGSFFGGIVSLRPDIPHRLEVIDLTSGARVSAPIPPLEIDAHLRGAPGGVVVAAADGLVGVDSSGAVRWTRQDEDERLEVLAETEAALVVGSVRPPGHPEQMLTRIERVDSRTGDVHEILEVALARQTWCGLVQDALIAVEQVDPFEPAGAAHSGHVLHAVPLPGSAATPWRVQYPGCLVQALVTADSIVAMVTTIEVGGRWLVAIDPHTGQELDRLELRPGKSSLTVIAGHAVLVPTGREDREGPAELLVIGGRDAS